MKLPFRSIFSRCLGFVASVSVCVWKAPHGTLHWWHRDADNGPRPIPATNTTIPGAEGEGEERLKWSTLNQKAESMLIALDLGCFGYVHFYCVAKRIGHGSGLLSKNPTNPPRIQDARNISRSQL